METNIVGASLFDNIKHIDDEGNEYWYARELQKILDYSQWRRFEDVINKAITSCRNNEKDPNYYFAIVGKIVKTGVSTIQIKDFKLSRYACYLIAQNGDPRKKIISLAQNYFVTKTREQELEELVYKEMSEDDKRIYHRNITKKKNYLLD